MIKFILGLFAPKPKKNEPVSFPHNGRVYTFIDGEWRELLPDGRTRGLEEDAVCGYIQRKYELYLSGPAKKKRKRI
jgi:hypothetical protein